MQYNYIFRCTQLIDYLTLVIVVHNVLWYFQIAIYKQLDGYQLSVNIKQEAVIKRMSHLMQFQPLTATPFLLAF